jgi:hypothetical protein
MPYSVDFDSKNRIVRSRFHGKVTVDDLKHFARNGHKHIALTNPAFALIDMTATVSFEASAATMAEFARIPPIIEDPGIPRVIIAPSAEVFGLSRMFEIRAVTHHNTHVVRTEEDAWAIFAVRNPKFKPLTMD